MRYIRDVDYLLKATSRNFQQFISDNPLIKNQAELLAIDMVRSKLIQRWDCDAEFKPTYVWSILATYAADDVVYLDGDDWTDEDPYPVNTVILFGGNIYLKNSNIVDYVDQEPEDTAYWILLGKQYDMFNVIIKEEWFDSTTTYLYGEKVYFKGSYYTAKSSVKGITPDNKSFGANYWGTKTAATIPTGTLPTNTTYFLVGDNRSSIIFNMVIDIAIYKIELRLSPQVAQKHREKSYDEALDQLSDFMHGNAVLENFPVKQEIQGLRTMMVSNPKNPNTY